MRGKLARIKPCHPGAQRDDVLTAFGSSARRETIAPAIDRPENTAIANPCRSEPGIERLDRAARLIDHVVMLDASGLGSPEVNGQEGREGRRRPGQGVMGGG